MTAPEREALVKALRARRSHWRSSDGSSGSKPDAMCQQAADMIEALSSPAVTVTEGWKLVPIKPTPEMLAAGEREQGEGWIGPAYCWAAMIAASPASPRKSERDAALEEAACVIDNFQEAISNKTGRYLSPRTHHNLMGTAYADGIRALKSTTPQTGSQE